MEFLKNLYDYRELLKSNIKKEIRGKYKGSFLGVLWSFVNPLLMATVYAIVFPLILRGNPKDYFVFVIIGVIPWNFFTTIISQGTNNILVNGNIIKKVYFPREIMPISVATSGLVNFFISCAIILLFTVFSGVGVTWHIILLPIVAIIQYLFVLGIILILSAVDVYIRDTEYIVNFIVMMAFYATPIVYDMNMFGDYKWILNFNPMTHIIQAYRDIFYYHQMIDWQMLAIVAIGSGLLCYFGYKVFKKLERGFAEEL